MNNLNRKRLRIAGAVLFVVAGFILAFNSIVAKIIEKKADAFLLDENLKHYQVQYNRVGFNFLNRSVSLVGLQVIPDSVYLDSIAKADLNTIVTSVAIGRITVSGIDFGALLKGGDFTIKKITVKKPEIKLYKFNGAKKTVKKKEKKEGFFVNSVRLAKFAHPTEIKGVFLKKTKFIIYNYKQQKVALSSDNISITLKGLKLEPSEHKNDFFYLTLNEALLVAKNNYIALANPLYEIKFRELTADLTKNTLFFKGFHYLSPYSKKSFSKHIKFQKERFDFYAGEVGITGIGTYRFFADNEIHIRKVTISDALIDLYRDKNVPFNHAQRPLLPNQSLKRIKGKFKIDSVFIRNTLFTYAEKMPGRNQPLRISFNSLSGYVAHISDLPSVWKNIPLKVVVNALFMKQAPVHVQFIFPMWAKSDTFYFSGAIRGAVPFTIFNPAIFPASGLKFTHGTFLKMTFRGGANPSYSKGTMTMLYHDMSFEAMKKKDSSRTNKFVSWGVNSFVRRNNPRKGKEKEAKSVALFFRRDVEKGFGNFFWKTLYSGMKATLIPSVNTMNLKNIQAVSPDTKEVKAQGKKTGK